MKIRDELKEKEENIIWGLKYHVKEFNSDLLALEKLESELKELGLNSLDLDWIKACKEINKAHKAFIKLITKTTPKGTER